MTSGSGATYGYNAQNLRTFKTINGETDNFVLVAGNVWSDGDADYFRGIELISNGTQLYLYNIRGDVIQLVNYSGIVTKTYDYDAYGNELQRDLNDENPFRYCGEYYDTETGLIYLRARYYDPMVGRFTSVDPVKDGLNWYEYCYNNPVFYKDENGLFPITALLITMGLVVSYRIGDYILAEHNYKHNSEIENGYREKGLSYGQSYIYGQGYPTYENYMYGFYSDGYNTCEVIAIHNVKVYLGIESTLSQTIYDMQRAGGMWLHGRLGSSPGHIPVLLKEYGIDFTDIYGLDDMTQEGMYIVSYWSKKEDKDLFGLHAIAIEHKDGAYNAYNFYSTSSSVKTLSQENLDEISLYFVSGYYITNS